MDGQGCGVEVTYDGLAEQVAMTRTRVREAIARLEKIGVLVPATVPGGGRSKLYGVDWSALGHDANVPEAPGQADEAPSTAPHRSGRGQARSGAVEVSESDSQTPATWSDDAAAETLCLQLAAAVTAHRGHGPGCRHGGSPTWACCCGASDRHRGSATDADRGGDGDRRDVRPPGRAEPQRVLLGRPGAVPGALRSHWSQLVLALRRSAPKRGTGDIVAAMNTWNNLISEDGT